MGQIYLMGNPLLAEPLRPVHVKRGCWGTGALGHWGTGALGHWGTAPGLNLTSTTPSAAQTQVMCSL
jgi:xylulose-5-phosphate/fructose-6-phosphate phosphoketolase